MSPEFKASAAVVREASSKHGIESLLGEISKINNSGTTVQLFDPDRVINRMHLCGAYVNALYAFASKTNASRKISTEMLLYAAMTRQIGKAIGLVGAKSGRRFVVFANSKPSFSKITGLLASSREFSTTKAKEISTAKKFGIGTKDLEASVLQKMAVSGLD
ncbi:MAG TPA: KEOPS complex subunit Cgi121 [Candidatus Acidoferrum sp.]|nr:KEOPS complex subunit Cgi121 [Candidatus Acidoferrum sp.]